MRRPIIFLEFHRNRDREQFFKDYGIQTLSRLREFAMNQGDDSRILSFRLPPKLNEPVSADPNPDGSMPYIAIEFERDKYDEKLNTLRYFFRGYAGKVLTPEEQSIQRPSEEEYRADEERSGATIDYE